MCSFSHLLIAALAEFVLQPELSVYLGKGEVLLTYDKVPRWLKRHADQRDVALTSLGLE